MRIALIAALWTLLTAGCAGRQPSDLEAVTRILTACAPNQLVGDCVKAILAGNAKDAGAD